MLSYSAMNKKERIQSIIDVSKEMLSKGEYSFKSIFNYFTSSNKDTVALIYRDNETNTDREFTYDQYKFYVKTFANKLSVLLNNVPKNSVVGLKLDNTPFWCFTFYGLLMAGYRPLLIDYKLEGENTINLLEAANAEAIISDDDYNYKVRHINKKAVNDINENLEFVESWADEVIFTSSGTTGKIKLAIFNGKNIVNQLNAALKMPEESLDIIYPQDIEPLRLIALIPFHHIFAFVSIFLWYSFYNGTIVFTSNKEPRRIVKDIRELEITHIYHVPLFYEVVFKNFINALDDKQKEKVKTLVSHNLGLEKGSLLDGITEKKIKELIFGNQIKYMISGGGYLANEVSTFFNGVGYPLYNGYGMTELGVTSVELSGDINVRIKRSIGHALYNVDYKLGEKDELLVKSPITHIKEIINKKEIATKLDEEGYFHTGDIAHIDNDGKTYLKGRLKDVIISSNGENVYPDEIESYFKKVSGVNSLCAFGSKKKIILVISCSKDIHEEVNRINKELPIHKQINNIIYTSEDLPLSASMKVKRYLVKEYFEDGKYEVKKVVNDEYKDHILSSYDQTKVIEVVDKLDAIFKKVLFIKEDFSHDAHWINDLKSDSMTYITLVSEIDNEFKTKIPLEKYGKLTTLNEFAKELLDSICK